MARIKRVGLNIIEAISKNFRGTDSLPNEFSELKAPSKNDYTNYML